MPTTEIEHWIDHIPGQREFRRAVHTILYAIASAHDLQSLLVLKGGILLSLAYASSRFTKDIDFSTSKTAQELDAEATIQKLEDALIVAVETLGYGIDCRVHGWEQRPPGEYHTFPTLRIRIGYADQNDRRAHQKLVQLNATQVVRVDLSLNEPLGDPTLLEVDGQKALRAYSFHDLVAEKYRALIQQEVRNRIRRQDTYDLYLLLKDNVEADKIDVRRRVLSSLRLKSAARNLPIDSSSLRREEVIRRSKAEYGHLAHEVEGVLPSFDEAYEAIALYYESLPWDESEVFN